MKKGFMMQKELGGWEKKGFKVIRFWNSDLSRHIDIVKDVLASEHGWGET